MNLLEAVLQQGRPWIRVGDAYEVTKAPRGLNRSTFTEIPFAAMEAIPQDGSYAPVYTMRRPDAISSGTYFEKGDILVAKITPSFENGKQALASELPGSFAYGTTEVIPLHARQPGYDPRLLFFYLLHPDVRHHVAERMEGSTGRQRVPESVLLDLPIPDLSPHEQTACANVLEAIQKASSIQTKAAAVAQDLKRAVMQALFSRGLRGEARNDSDIGALPASWKVASLGEHHSVVSGGTPARGNPAYWEGGYIPWVKTSEVDYCVIEDTEEHITEAGLAGSAAKLLPIGTLLMAMYGQGVTRGKVALLGVPAACNQACAAIRPTDGSVEGRYLYQFLAYRYEDIRQLAHGGQQQNLNLDIVRGIPIAFPADVKEQMEIVDILEAIDRKITLHRRKRIILDDLFKALLHKLMTGELRAADLDLSALEAAPLAEAPA